MGTVYGTGWIDAAYTHLDTLMDALVVSMAADDPKPSYVYRGHNTAYVQLNGITIDLADVELGHLASDSQNVCINWNLVYSIRVHTAYEGGINDPQTNWRLLNSIYNKLMANRHPDTEYYIRTIGAFTLDEEFLYTLGGSLQVVVGNVQDYAQE